MNWYILEDEEVVSKLNSSVDGLTQNEAVKRLEQNGYNELPKAKKKSIFKIFIEEAIDPIEILLFMTIIFSLIINEIIDAIAIFLIIMTDLTLGTLQAWKASKNAESLSNMIKVKNIVIRDGKETLIDSSKLVVGDIVLFTSGDKISADLRVLDCANLTVDESSLTGESINVAKSSECLGKEVVLARRTNMLYAGTSVITGRAKCIVVDTGSSTEIGKIAGKVTETVSAKSPLTIRMNKFSKQITLLVVIVAIIIAVLLFLKGDSGESIFLSVIALSVSAMPEGLPLALTMALSIASSRMAKNNVVVKHLNAVESLGSCTVIASDKTGTLTVNEQTAKKICLADGTEFSVEGTGYNSDGEVICKNDSDISKAKKIALMGMINNEATLEFENGWKHMGDSIDIAFLALAQKLEIENKVKIVGEIPYESENKFSAVFYEDVGEISCTVKGSIETVLSFCDKMDMGEQGDIKIDCEQIFEQQENLAKQGFRIIALASGKGFQVKEQYLQSDIKELTYLGMVAFIDPIRIEAKNAIAECKKAGIKVIMITGDHPLTASAIAADLDMCASEDCVVSGEDVKRAFEKGEKFFDEFVASKSVFTQVTPLEKLEIVESFRRQGEFIAVTGDGVNDAPAIKSANIGIAMGSGTDVAKETSDMIIVDDNFKSIVAGIKEGRTAYSNIRKVCYMLLSCGVSEVFFFIMSILFNLPMPLVAIQLLWLNIITNGLQDLALSFEKAEPNIMNETPRNTKESVFNKDLLLEIAVSGLTIGLMVFVFWKYLIDAGVDVTIARSYIMVLMVFIQNIHVFNCRSEKLSAFKMAITSNPFVVLSVVVAVVLQIVVMEVPVLSSFLQATSMPIIDIFKLFLISIIILVVMEVYKLIKYKFKFKRR